MPQEAPRDRMPLLKGACFPNEARRANEASPEGRHPVEECASCGNEDLPRPSNLLSRAEEPADPLHLGAIFLTLPVHVQGWKFLGGTTALP